MRIKQTSEEIYICETNIKTLGQINGKNLNGTTISWGNEFTGNFNCFSNHDLRNFSGAPEIITGAFIGFNNPNITSLKGMPKQVTGNISIWGCNITSLEGITNKIGGSSKFNSGFLNIYKNPITSFGGIHKHFQGGYVDEIKIPSEVTSNLLGVLLINRLLHLTLDNESTSSILKQAVEIVNRHLHGDRDVLECQEELRAKGFKEYAKL